MLKITVYGAGYVGLVTAVCLAEIGHHVVCMDVDSGKIALLNQGKVPFYEPGLDSLLEKNQHAKRLTFTSDVSFAAAFSTIHFIAVGTPSLPDGAADLRYVFHVAEQLAEHCIDNSVVINKSTVPVGTAQAVAALIEQKCGKPLNFTVVSNPEFLREGCAIHDFMAADRIIIGTEDNLAIATLQALYQPLTTQGVPLLVMHPRSAELTKYAANAMLATKISFINELSQIAEVMNADIEEVSRGIGYDKRIGPHFIAAGCGYGGSCFPKDVSALTTLAQQHYYEPKLIHAVSEVNHQQKQWLFKQLGQYYQQDLNLQKIAIWGLAFKPNTDDMREASSIELISQLSKIGAKLQVYDPVAMENAKAIFTDISNISYAASAYEALHDADCLVIVTEWSIFKEADLTEVYQQLKQPVIFDGRNIYSLSQMAKLGFNYISVGRASILKGARDS